MKYLLDTNIISYWMRGDTVLMDKIKSHSPSDLSLSTITLAEILYGIEKSPVRKEERTIKIKQILSVIALYPFDEAAAREYAVIRSNLEKSGNVISERDTQIASIGLANQLVVVTHNLSEFTRIEKLEVEDWA
ncbi:MAG: PIN domain-containing protein [Pseudomonadota bacterium]